MPEFTDDLLRKLLVTFQAEAAEHLQTINQSLLGLERNPSEKERAPLLQDAFRAAHSLKGAARAVSLEEIEKLSHSMENILQEARDAGRVLDAITCDILYNTLDIIEKILNGESVDIHPTLSRLDESTTHDEDTSAAEPATNGNIPQPEMHEEFTAPLKAGEETIRVSVNKLDDLMAQVGELLVAKISAEQRQIDIQDIQNQFRQLNKTWREISNMTNRQHGTASTQLGEVLNRHAEHMQALIQQFSQFNQTLTSDTVRLGMATTSLQDKVRSVRMVPFQSLNLILERAIRDAARLDNKQVKFQIDGADIEMDKKVLEMLKDPLLHLLRNAVNHGIESPESRIEANKPTEGHITLSVRQRGSEVRIAVKDDGRGFDVAALRRAARKYANNGVDDNTSDDDLINMAFLPGVTTSNEITTLSGRGVGLDVVRQKLESIQGRISVNNQPGVGVTVELIVPTSLAMTRGLMVRTGPEHYVLPLLSIEKIVELDATFVVGGKRMVTIENTPLPLVHLSAVLERRTSNDEPAPNPLIVIMGVAEQRLALLVDDVMTEQELAIKPLGNPLQRIRNVTGAALLGNGEPIIVLNPADLVKSAHQVQSYDVAVHTQNGRHTEITGHILVVDDSITTRTLEKNILEAAGFEVTTATDGVEAFKRLGESAIDLVVADVEMPNMDGVTLTRHLREHNEYSELPIILVTSLESREDRERGMTAGADAYIVKRGFDQAELLATIQRLL